MTTQGAMFGDALDLPGADVEYVPAFLDATTSDRLFAELTATTTWRHDMITMYGRTNPIPRLNAWYGEPGLSYTYSHIRLDPLPFTPALLEIKSHIEPAAHTTFNSVLVNLYRDGNDSVSWHTDDEAALGPEPIIGSVSLGATRSFQIRNKADRSLRRALPMTHGSLLIMRGATQQLWEHQVPRTARPVGTRLNLTFRTIS